MVSLKQAQASNALIPSTLPQGLVAVFVGATSGIGEYTIKAFAKATAGLKPRVYFVGRSQSSGDRILAELQHVNADGEYVFIQADCSSLKAVDDACRQLQAKEKAINLLFMSQGSISGEGKDWNERAAYILSLVYFGRTRFILNLLPQLQRATALRRVLSIGAGGQEGPMDLDDPFVSKKTISLSSLPSLRVQLVTMTTLSLCKMAELAPSVSFFHSFPGIVATGLGRGSTAVDYLTRGVMTFLGPLIAVPAEEVGARYVFLATSATYPAGQAGGKPPMAVPVMQGMEVIEGVDGQVGSGVYSLDEKGESGGVKSQAVIAGLKGQGAVEKLWERTVQEMRSRGATVSV